MFDKMKKNLSVFLLIFSVITLSWSVGINSVQKIEKNIYFFWGVGCPHCTDVETSGILDEVSEIYDVSVYKLEVYNNQKNREKYSEFANKLNISDYQRGVPFLVIECGDKLSYLTGSASIINNLKDEMIKCDSAEDANTSYKNFYLENSNSKNITLPSIIIAAFIDSINPCAFGVLIFLLATMISISSPKRTLKHGMIYVFVIFLVYFSVGLGILKILTESAEILKYIFLVTGTLILIGGLIEIKDFFWYGKGISLKIPSGIKPNLEKIAKKSTLPSVIFLGIAVALVELPCTGGIYLAILSLMHINKIFGIPYLILYNIIFVLPLIFIVMLSYYGVKITKIQGWVERNKKWTRLITGLVMIGLAIYLLNYNYNLV